ncbi:putative receptor-like protein kinase [Salvia divinorum]|uniref:non-specific serine/threonine protein kinase n=1 Tax=Salvia divinorum TaxID=28513 RepID=A0ABD1HDR2_SALDI
MASRQPFPPNPRPKASILFLAITISTSIIILSAILYFLYYLWYTLVQRSRTSPFDGASPLKLLQRFSYKELKNATNSFSSSNCIGKGGSCTVFRGILRDGKLVAVKLLDSASFQCEQEFQNELKILGGIKSCPFVVSLLGFCVEGEKRLVVYEYMPNRSLQESLFSESDSITCGETRLCWGRRFGIIHDVAKALAFLHNECDPAVIHGDVKPSNVLLDTEFRAKLSDFGLSRLKVESEGEIGVDLFSQDLWKSQELSGNLNAGVGGGGENESTPNVGTPVESHENDEVDFALALQASASSKSNCRVYHNVLGLAINSLNFNFSPDCGSENRGGGDLKGKELSANENGGVEWNKFVPYDDELSSVDHSKELNSDAAIVGEANGCQENMGAKQWGKDWWWKQDGSGEFCSKDYVMEWIGSQICHSTDWDEEKGAVEEKASPDHAKHLYKCEKVSENSVQEPAFECGGEGVEKEDSKRRRARGRKHRKMHEWWKEEEMDEVKKASRLRAWSRGRFKVPHMRLGKCFKFKNRRKLRTRDDHHHNADDQNMEFSFRKGWRRKNAPRSMGSEDLFSRELSSTTSMRGTLCYVAPEYNGYGYLMEKADIYSLGVLILVIISGRRPLHVLSSPMKLEKANLISWCKSLAHSGNTLELVDQRLRDEYSKEQATLCINLALACLQKMPELRPEIGDIVKVLKGEMELPSLPFEFSPSPPPKLHSRSRRRLKSCVD